MNALCLNTGEIEFRHDYNNSIMPVIKINFKGDILYANMSSFDLLISWGCLAGRKLPTHIYEKVNGSKLLQNRTFGINYLNKKINFVVVPFAEAGYIGIYAYEIISNELNN